MTTTIKGVTRIISTRMVTVTDIIATVTDDVDTLLMQVQVCSTSGSMN